MLRVLQANNYDIPSYCGGRGQCGKCRVFIIKGAPEVTDEEKNLLEPSEIKQGTRLACCHFLEGDLEIKLPEEVKMEVLTEGLSVSINLEPRLRVEQIDIDLPSLDDQTDYLERIKRASRAETINPALLSGLEALAKKGGLDLILDKTRIADIRERKSARTIYGIAIDIGTTTIAMYLLDIVEGKELGVYSLTNPQYVFGADVISRINYTTRNENGVKKLQNKLLKELNNGIDTILKENKVDRDALYQISIAGNTVMLHTLLGISARTIAISPYIPVFTDEISLEPQEIGIDMNPCGIVQLMPSFSAFIGADILGDMLVAELDSQQWNLLIDFGTNGEIVLGKGGKIYACSAAAGPAFEGAKIKCGLAGVPGAISGYNSQGYQTIGNKRPAGICGPGLPEIILMLLNEGYIDKTGVFKDFKDLSHEQSRKLLSLENQKAFLVASGPDTSTGRDIVLTQKDIREFQLAKSAIAVGIRFLIEEAGIENNRIENVYLAGGFGNFINAGASCRIGLIPAVLEDRIIRIGNGAGQGAKVYLLDNDQSKRANELRRKMSYLELAKMKDFHSYFMKNLNFQPVKSD
ncbi:MAG: ASKHA domain-containing protein [Desulfobacteraceae bacterium]|nr:ASKHA domain-containing protein [Desulfobacteraceae bacterium]